MVIKLKNNKYKEKVDKAAKKKGWTTEQGKSTNMTVDFPKATTESRRQLNSIFKILR